MAVSCPNCGAQVAAGLGTCPACNAVVKSPSHLIGALTYLLGLVTGVVFLYLEPYDRDDYVRFHARQSIAFSVAWLAVNVILGVFIAVLPRALGELVSFAQGVVNVALAILWVYLMYQAYIGNRFRVPVLADWVDSVGL